jgi:dTDP-4-dehydrorhamnose 3,5-epimerase
VVGLFVTIGGMQKQPTTLLDVFLIQPDVFPDDRGLFFESYNKNSFLSLGINDDFVQDSVSFSKRHVLRGLHFQKEPYAQAKLVSVLKGEVFDVAVDIRKDSKNYGKWFGTKLTEKDHTMMYIPAGFAHGFLSLSDETVFMYKISGSVYNKESASGIAWNDPTLKIEWPLPAGTQPILSTQDMALPKFEAS